MGRGFGAAKVYQTGSPLTQQSFPIKRCIPLNGKLSVYSLRKLTYFQMARSHPKQR
jgi:hypothetical protein